MERNNSKLSSSRRKSFAPAKRMEDFKDEENNDNFPNCFDHFFSKMNLCAPYKEKNNSKLSSSRRKKSFAPAKRMEDFEEEENYDNFPNSFDNYFSMMNLPKLYERAVVNVDNKVANMSVEEIEEAVQKAKHRLSIIFPSSFEKPSTTSPSPERQSLQPSVKKNLKKIPQKKKARAKSKGSEENFQKSKETNAVSPLRKSTTPRRPPDRYVPDTKSLEKCIRNRRIAQRRTIALRYNRKRQT